MKIAIVGSGIAGLGAAHLLSKDNEVWVFEREDRIGGHTRTVAVAGEAGPVAVDTGFIVHNRDNYPLLVRLLGELGVATCASDMSFAAQGAGLDWCSRGLNGLLTTRSNLFSPRYWGFWKEVLRFNRVGLAELASGGGEVPLGAFLERHRFSRDFRESYLLPMAGAVWSTAAGAMEAFPARTLLRFFHNHGMLGLATQKPWRTIPGGTSSYLEPLTRAFRDRIRTGVEVRATRVSGGVDVRVAGEEPVRFDHLVLACHGDQALPILERPTALEQEVLGSFRSNASPTILHEDAGILPRERRGWAAWNTRVVAVDHPMLLTYHMNRLQPLATRRDFFVSLHAEGLVDEAKVHLRLPYEHPRFDLEAIRAQGRWAEISGRNRVHYCGAYWRYGFHEDGLWSGLRVAMDLGVTW